MAKKTIARYFSDISGDTIEADSPTVTFSLNGISYEIDLTESEQSALNEAFAPYVAAGRKISRNQARNQSKARTSGNGTPPKEIRSWAESQGIAMPARGRIPSAVVEAYNAAH
jgi:hypothetical protein